MEDLGLQNHLWLHSQFEVGLHQTLSEKEKKITWTWEMSHQVKGPSCKHHKLSSTPKTPQKKKKVSPVLCICNPNISTKICKAEKQEN